MKIIKSISIMLLLLFSAVMLCSCGKTQLTTIDAFDIDYDNELSWDSIDNARGYEIAIGKENNELELQECRKTHFSLDYLAEGDYEIKVRVLGNDKKYTNSEWSDTVYFHKDYSSGCIYELINGNTEFQIKKTGKATGDVVIEDIFKGKPVTQIAKNAFKGNTDLTSIKLGNNITYIGDNAFYNCVNLKTITLGDNIEYIGSSAFQSCRSLVAFTAPSKLTQVLDYTFAYCRSIESITLGDNVVSLGECAFSDCTTIKDVTISDSVVSLGEYCFAGCTELENVKVGENVNTIGDYAFYKCTKLKNVDFSLCTQLQKINQFAFANCDAQLTSITLPEGLEEIGEQAFYADSELINISIPSTVWRIGANCFYKSKLYLDVVEAGGKLVYAGDWLVDTSDDFRKFLRVGTTTLDNEITSLEESISQKQTEIDSTSDATLKQQLIEEKTFLENTLTTKQTELSDLKVEISKYIHFGFDNDSPEKSEGWSDILKSTTVGIADQVFTSSIIIEKVIIPQSIKYVGRFEFYSCSNLKNVQSVIGNNLKLVDDYCFADSPVSNVVFQNGIERIGSFAFYKTQLNNNTSKHWIPDSVTSIGTYAFYKSNLWNNPTNGLVYADRWLVGFNGNLSTNITLQVPEKTGDSAMVVGISDYAFFNCSDIESIQNMQYVEYIGEGAFYKAQCLQLITLNSEITELKDYTFYGCSGLLEIKLPKFLESVGLGCFYGCMSLSTIDIPNNVTEIADYAFYYCSNLSSVSFGKKVQTIGERAFYNCTSLTAIVVPDTVTTIGERAFGDCEYLESVTFGENSNLTSIGDCAFFNCMELKEIIIPNKVTTIGESAFEGCVSITNLVIGNSVLTIGDYAFSDLISLTSARIASSVEYIGEFAFKNASSLEVINISKNTKTILAHAFYGCDMLTIYTDAEEVLTGWENRFNSSYRPVITGCTFASDNSYVISLVYNSEQVKNVNVLVYIAKPQREGYIFKGFGINENEVCYSIEDLCNIPDGTKVYTIWEQVV